MAVPDVDLRYDAFISYRRSDGSVHAQRLCRKLLDYKLPPELTDEVSKQELSIYLDTRYERADSDFFEDTIKPALRESRHLIVVQTPDALKPHGDGKPNWVEREIEYFCSLSPKGRKISIALAKGDFNGPLAGDLRRRFPQIQIVDIRRLGSLRPGSSHHELLKFVGALYEVPRELMPELRQEDAQRRAARLRVYLTAAVLLLAVLSGLLGWALYSRHQTQKALSQSDLREASTLIEKDEAGQGLAFLARAIRLDPDNLPVRTWMTDLLLRRTWSVPVLEIRDEERFVDADLSPDGKLLLTATKAGKVQIRDARTGRPIGAPWRHPEGISTARFSPDGMRVLTSDSSSKSRIWDSRTGNPIAELPKAMFPADFIPNSSTLILSIGNQVEFWDARTGRPKAIPLVLTTPENIPFVLVRFSPDKRHLMTVELREEEDWGVVLRELPTGRVLKTLMTSPTIITDASFSHDGNLLAVAFEEGRVQVCNVASGQIVGEPLHHGAPISSIQFSPDHRKILTSSYDRTARAWDALTGTPLIEPIQHGGFVSSARFSPNSHQVITTSWDGVVRLWEIQTGKTGSEILTAAGHIALSPDARKAASFSTNRIDFHELPSGQIFGRSLALTHPVNGLGFSDDGRYIAIFSNPTSDGGTWDLREVESGRKICRSPFKAVDIVFSSRAEKLAIVKKETVILCDAKTGRILKNRFPHHGIRTAIALSPDGK